MLVKTLKVITVLPCTYVPNNINIESFDNYFLKTIEASEVQIMINNFRDDTAAKYDRLSVKILKFISDMIVNRLVPTYLSY